MTEEMQRRRHRRWRTWAMRLWWWFFPPPVELGDPLRRTVEALLPDLDLNRVTFHRAMPHLFRWIPNSGITLPHLWRARHTRVYVASGHWRPASRAGLGLILHEAWHARQAQECAVAWGGRDVGPLRPFVILYLAAWAGHGFRYLGHPMEVEAFDFAGTSGSRFERWCARAAPSISSIPWRRLGAEHPEPLREEELRRLRAECSELCRPRTPLRTGRVLADSIPGWRQVARTLRRSPRGRSWKWPLMVLVVPLGGVAYLVWALFWGAVTAILWAGVASLEVGGAVLALLCRVLAWVLDSLEALVTR